MKTCSYPIVGGDYANAGNASSDLKAVLKRIGVAPEIVRRTIIAAYEAETNVVIHARHGEMRVTVGPGEIEVEVSDEGPGIPDIEQAMKEGFSTAPAAARELGFGAGMGLPNIRKNSDRFVIRSTVGKGTHLQFSVGLSPHEAAGMALSPRRHENAKGEPEQEHFPTPSPALSSFRGPATRSGVAISAELCTGCLRCLHNCPTQALRVRADDSQSTTAHRPSSIVHRPLVLDHLCINCGECIRACRAGALAMSGGAEFPDVKGRALIVPSSFFFQFGARLGPERVLGALSELGFSEVRELGPWREALQRATEEYAAHRETLPVISPACPAVTALIEMRFPSLIRNIAPFASPIEAACDELASRAAIVVASCPSECAALSADQSHLQVEIISPAVLARAIMPLLKAERGRRTAKSDALNPQSERQSFQEVSGIGHVIRALEEIENGLLDDVAVVELYACGQGCFGSPFLREDPFVARRRAGEQRRPAAARALRREKPYGARPGLRLDEDMGKAIQKLSQIEKLRRTLPGSDCGLCGAPTCDAFAEDIVLGRGEGQKANCKMSTGRARSETP